MYVKRHFDSSRFIGRIFIFTGMECDELFQKLRENLYPSKIQFVRGLLQTDRCQGNFLEKEQKSMEKCLGKEISQNLRFGFWNRDSEIVIIKCYSDGLGPLTEKLHGIECSQR
jgi:hypothetical protein